jgi:hypothetical protein
MCTVRKVTDMWYTVQGPGYFNLLPNSWRQSSREGRGGGGEMNILKEKYCFCAPNIFSGIEPNKIKFQLTDLLKFIISFRFRHYDYLPLGAKNASCYTLVGCTSKPVRLLCFLLLHGRNSKYTHVERMAYLSAIYTEDGNCRVAT